jgi:hypothetical protein
MIGETSGRVLLVGTDNPYGDVPEFALYCYPPGSAGHRLRRILGLSEDQYLALHRTNLCSSGAWSLPIARQRAAELLEASAPWRVIVLLGADVGRAFAYDRPFFTHAARGETQLVSLPHQSGRNVLWNNAKHRLRAREILGDLVPEVPWGSDDVAIERAEGLS